MHAKHGINSMYVQEVNKQLSMFIKVWLTNRLLDIYIPDLYIPLFSLEPPLSIFSYIQEILVNYLSKVVMPG